MVEQQLEKYKKDEEEEKLQGGWHTEVSLTALNWTEFPSCRYVHTYMHVCSMPKRLFASSLLHKVDDCQFAQVGASAGSIPHQ